ncbi:tetratricopeptide repeat protein [Flavobacterium sp. NRK1]|uniref:tetratricopeptide repeat protein n=1 Tax=Flavobacterium sp. NRK1 TaxID=2954929 RepID=UPI002093A7D2|nr:tetratricopeptide repeat protein [Flavobacterium sp. NRK1]MCO6148392.1 tetratricopeptide repeat protein [Flavobacterium sp. NRK1]
MHAQTKIQEADSLIQFGIDAMREEKFSKSIELFTKARTIAEKNHLDKQLFLALVNIGNNYQNMFDYGEALDYFLKGYAISIKLEPEAEIMVVHNIANVYVLEELYEKAEEYYKKAYETALQNNSADNLKGVSLGSIGYSMMLRGEVKKSREYIVKGLKYLKEYPRDEFTIKSMLIENTLLIGNTAEARKEALQLYNTSPYIDYGDGGVNLLFIVAKSYLKEKSFEEAERYTRKILEEDPNLESKREIYSLLTDIYIQKGSLLKALTYKDSVFKIQNELNNIKNGRQLENNKVKFEIQGYKKQIAANKEKFRLERRVYYSAFAIVLAIIVIVFLIYKQKRVIAARNRNLILLDLEKEKNNNLLLEKQVTNALLEQERLKNEVEARNRKLSAKALHLSGRNELLEEILEYLSKRPKFSKDPTLAAYIQSLKDHLKTDNAWNDFIVHFEQVNSGFMNRLKSAHPTLTVSDIRFIAYMYMNLSVKEIAFILNITPVASKKRKERLAAKMEIPKDEDLYDYIASL